MTEFEFKIFSRLIQEVWRKSFAEMKLKKPIEGYETKLYQLVALIEDQAIDIQKEISKKKILNRKDSNKENCEKIETVIRPITRRTIRKFTDVILEINIEVEEIKKFNPSSKTKEILCRYVLDSKKLTGEDLKRWVSEKEYKLETHWKIFKTLNATTVEKNEEQLENVDNGSNKTIQFQDGKKSIKTQEDDIQEDNKVNRQQTKSMIVILFNSGEKQKIWDLLMKMDVHSLYSIQIIKLKKRYEEITLNRLRFSEQQYRKFLTEIDNSLAAILKKL